MAEVLIERIDSARGDGYILDDTDESTIISRWLLALNTRRGAPAVLAATYYVAKELAIT